jgi:hypothetical protein
MASGSSAWRRLGVAMMPLENRLDVIRGVARRADELGTKPSRSRRRGRTTLRAC